VEFKFSGHPFDDVVFLWNKDDRREFFPFTSGQFPDMPETPRRPLPFLRDQLL